MLARFGSGGLSCGLGVGGRRGESVEGGGEGSGLVLFLLLLGKGGGGTGGRSVVKAIGGGGEGWLGGGGGLLGRGIDANLVEVILKLDAIAVLSPEALAGSVGPEEPLAARGAGGDEAARGGGVGTQRVQRAGLLQRRSSQSRSGRLALDALGVEGIDGLCLDELALRRSLQDTAGGGGAESRRCRRP